MKAKLMLFLLIASGAAMSGCGGLEVAQPPCYGINGGLHGDDEDCIGISQHAGVTSAQTTKSVSAFLAHADVLEHIKRPKIMRTVEVATRDRAVVDFDCPKGWEVDQSALDVEFHSAAEFLRLSLAFRCRLPTMSEIQWRAYVKSWDKDEERELAKTGMHLDATPQTGHSLRWEVNLPQPAAVKKMGVLRPYVKPAAQVVCYKCSNAERSAIAKHPILTVPMTTGEIESHFEAEAAQRSHPEEYPPTRLDQLEWKILYAHLPQPAGDCHWKGAMAHPTKGYVGRVVPPNVVYTWGYPMCALY